MKRDERPYDRFDNFIAPKADRLRVILDCCVSLKLVCCVIPVAGNNHIFVFPPGHKPLRMGGTIPVKEPYMLVAHYDRVTNSQGANDNSIAVFHLLKAASQLAEKDIKNWMVVFTDKEELRMGESFEAQGSYTLAEKLKSYGLQKPKIFNFDACGCGDTFIFSTTTDIILENNENAKIKNVKKNIRQLRDHALAAANALRISRVLLAPTPFSDDVGFLRAGYAAQTVTILPAQEAAQYENLLRSRPDFGNLIISGAIKEPSEYRRLPETWRSLNSAADTASRLTPQYFEQTVRFMVELCNYTTLP